jgi:hypothetical protein
MFYCTYCLLSNLFFTLSVLGHSLDRGEYVLFMSMQFRESPPSAVLKQETEPVTLKFAAFVLTVFPALLDALKTQDIEEVLLCLPSQEEVRDKLLRLACEDGLLSEVQLLLSAGIKVNNVDEDGRTPFLIAARGGHLPIVQFLLGAAADPNISKFEGTSPLYMAAQNVYYFH